MTEEKIYEVVMPKLGMIMTEAQLAEWHVEEGNWVNKGDPLFDFESDKSTITIEAPMSGTVHLVSAIGEIVPVKKTVAIITGKSTTAGESSQPDQAKSTTGTQQVEKIIASPKARVAARLKGTSLEGLSGTGPRGMIVAADVNKVTVAEDGVKASPLARKIARANQVDLTKLTGSGPRGQIVRADVKDALEIESQTAPIVAAEPIPSAEPVPLMGLRAVIAERLTKGWQERPQVTLTAEVDATDLVSARDQIIAETGKKVSYNTFMIQAAAKALHQMPFANVQLTEQGLVSLSQINIGVAVDTDRGLLVPVLRDADQKPLLKLDEEFKSLANRTLEGKCMPDELSGSSLTITNLGAFGIDAFTPIINPPEALILGVGRIALRPAVFNGQILPVKPWFSACRLTTV